MCTRDILGGQPRATVTDRCLLTGIRHKLQYSVAKKSASLGFGFDGWAEQCPRMKGIPSGKRISGFQEGKGFLGFGKKRIYPFGWLSDFLTLEWQLKFQNYWQSKSVDFDRTYKTLSKSSQETVDSWLIVFGKRCLTERVLHRGHFTTCWKHFGHSLRPADAIDFISDTT